MRSPSLFARCRSSGTRFFTILVGLLMVLTTLRGEPLVVQLDWRLNAQFAGLLVAERDGLYRQAGLEVKIRPLGDVAYTELARVVASTEGMVGSIEGGLFLSAVAEGLPLVAIGTMFQASPLGLISLESSGIVAPSDLAGRRVAVHGDGHEALDTVLAAAGLNRTTVNVSEAGYGMADLLNGRYDAKQGYLVDELVALRREGHAVRAIEYRQYGHHAYSQVFIVSTTTLAKHRQALRAFIAASSEGWRRAAADPDTTAEFLHTQHANDLPSATLSASLRLIIPLLTAEHATLGAMSTATWTAQATALAKTRPALTLPPMPTWVDFTLVLLTKDGEAPP